MSRSINIDFQGWHIWSNTQGRILISDPRDHSLHDYANVDDAVNWLYLTGHKDVARKLHSVAKGN